MNDWELLTAYVERNDEAAFAELVARYTTMVFASAARRAGSALAEDVTQAAFILLARKAPRLQQRGGATLASWLFRTTGFAAAESLRREARRRRREDIAAGHALVVEDIQPGRGCVRLRCQTHARCAELRL